MNAGEQISAALHPVTRARIAIERLTAMQHALHAGDWLAALRTADSFAAIFSDLLADVAQAAYNDGASKAAIARALGVPVGALRGMVRQ